MASKYALLQFDTNYLSQNTERNASVVALQNAAKDMSGSSETTEKLSIGVWLIDLRKDLPLLGRVCEAADSRNVPYRLLFLEQEPEWITYGEWK